MPVKITIGRSHEIVIPPGVGEELRLGPGDHLTAHVRDGVIVLVPDRGSAIDQLRGLHREIWADEDVQAFVDRERDSWETS